MNYMWHFVKFPRRKCWQQSQLSYLQSFSDYQWFLDRIFLPDDVIQNGHRDLTRPSTDQSRYIDSAYSFCVWAQQMRGDVTL